MGRTRNGEFYHYGLAALAASAAAIEPGKKGRAMCEIFGNYGWKEGVKLEKYLADHFLVRGINFFVPHAFSPKAYPDPDCPPHFYAHGNNPQYRHFGKLIRYMNRVSDLFTDGRRIVTAAVLYHGESEWCGNCMPFEKVMRRLNDCQICADVIPSDVFEYPERYRTQIGKQFQINQQKYDVFIIPEAEYISESAVNGIKTLQNAGFPVLFVNQIPKCCRKTGILNENNCEVVSLEMLAGKMRAEGFFDVRIAPENDRIRILHYEGEHTMFMLVNEGNAVYQGEVHLPITGFCYGYHAMENCLEQVNFRTLGEKTVIKVEAIPGKSLIYVFDDVEEGRLAKPLKPEAKKEVLSEWKRSQCRAIDYPNFVQEQMIKLPDNMISPSKGLISPDG